MITTQAELDSCLDRSHTISVEISSLGPLPNDNRAYDAIRNLPQNGFSFTPRELLHAIGCKTAALPSSEQDECLKMAWLYTHILNLQAPYLSFYGTYGSDLQAARSQEVGIGMMCLLAEKYFNIPWDQLGSLPGRGKRFDYRGTNDVLKCIFESKGTSHRATQKSQIDNGLGKKHAHHQRGEYFDIELIISSFIGRGSVVPRILLADPDKTSFKKLYERGDKRYYRLKHYCRVLQFVGLPRSAYLLNVHALDYLKGKQSLYRTIIDEKHERGFLESITIAGDEFLGRWFDAWLPKKSIRYGKLYEKEKKLKERHPFPRRLVFQGLRRDIYESGLIQEPFSRPLLQKNERERYKYFDQLGASVFPDGTVMIFKHLPPK